MQQQHALNSSEPMLSLMDVFHICFNETGQQACGRLWSLCPESKAGSVMPPMRGAICTAKHACKHQAIAGTAAIGAGCNVPEYSMASYTPQTLNPRVIKTDLKPFSVCPQVAASPLFQSLLPPESLAALSTGSTMPPGFDFLQAQKPMPPGFDFQQALNAAVRALPLLNTPALQPMLQHQQPGLSAAAQGQHMPHQQPGVLPAAQPMSLQQESVLQMAGTLPHQVASHQQAAAPVGHLPHQQASQTRAQSQVRGPAPLVPPPMSASARFAVTDMIELRFKTSCMN